MINKILRIVPICALIAASHAPARAENRLSATMGEVLLRNLQPGATYHLTSLLSFPLRLTYSSEQPAAIVIRPSLPEEAEMKAGYDPIPDPEWVRLEPSRFRVEKSSVVESNVTIAIPNDESLRGKKFIVYLWSQTMGEGKGIALGLGAKSRLLLSIATEKSTAATNVPAKSYMHFELSPSAVHLPNVQPGKNYDLRKALGKDFLVKNTGAEDKKFRLEIIAADSLDMSPPRDVQWGPAKTEFKITPADMKVKKRGSKKFNVSFKIPDEPESYGKKFQYLLRVTPEGVGMSSGILFRIGVETAKKS